MYAVSGLSASSESPHKLATPLRTPLASRHASPKVNGIREEPGDSRAATVSKTATTEELLMLEKINDTVADIKFKAEAKKVVRTVANDAGKTQGSVGGNKKDGGVARGVSSEVSLAGKDGSIGESEQETSPNRSQDFEPLSLDLGDPAVALDTVQPVDDDFYEYEQLEDPENWIPDGATMDGPKAEYVQFEGNEDISINTNSLSKDLNVDHEGTLNVDVESLVGKQTENESVVNENATNQEDVFVFDDDESKFIEDDSASVDRLEDNPSSTLQAAYEMSEDFKGFAENEPENETENGTEYVQIEDDFLSSAPLPDISRCSSGEFADFDRDPAFVDRQVGTSEEIEGTSVQDDDFGDFADFSEPTQFEQPAELHAADDDFGDFNDFESAFEQAALEEPPISLRESICRIENRNVCVSLFFSSSLLVSYNFVNYS